MTLSAAPDRAALLIRAYPSVRRQAAALLAYCCHGRPPFARVPFRSRSTAPRSRHEFCSSYEHAVAARVGQGYSQRPHFLDVSARPELSLACSYALPKPRASLAPPSPLFRILRAKLRHSTESHFRSFELRQNCPVYAILKSCRLGQEHAPARRSLRSSRCSVRPIKSQPRFSDRQVERA